MKMIFLKVENRLTAIFMENNKKRNFSSTEAALIPLLVNNLWRIFILFCRLGAWKIILYTSVNPWHVIKNVQRISHWFNHSFRIHQRPWVGWGDRNWDDEQQTWSGSALSLVESAFFRATRGWKSNWIRFSWRFALLSFSLFTDKNLSHYSCTKVDIFHVPNWTTQHGAALDKTLLYHHQQQSSFTVLMAMAHTKKVNIKWIEAGWREEIVKLLFYLV